MVIKPKNQGLEDKFSSILVSIESLRGENLVLNARFSELETKFNTEQKLREKIKFLIISLIIGALFSATIKPHVRDFFIFDDRKEVVYEET